MVLEVVEVEVVASEVGVAAEEEAEVGEDFGMRAHLMWL